MKILFMKHFIVLSLFFLILNNCSPKTDQLKPTGDYLGQQLTSDSAEIFAPGIISTELYERDFTISPAGDEIYYTIALGNNSYSAIATTKRVNGKWTEPRIAKFSKNPQYKDLEPHISPDGEKFYFVSNRPRSEGQDSVENWDIWVMDKKGTEWSKPYNLGAPVNSPAREFFPSVTNTGTIYFTREDKNVENGIFRSRLINRQYTEPERLPEQINAGRARYNAFIVADESYIIVPVYGLSDSYGGTDYYISFRNQKDEWSEPLNMGPQINSAAGAEWSASVSPDSKYIFFMTDREENISDFTSQPLTIQRIRSRNASPYNGDPNLYWIRADIIDSLKSEIME
ncbi:MAG: hypothetical protein K9M80_09420 [Candidatus Marinimicrobia bacterium]|nr:hypothetical protein [Candidatus Neomarinimicrobiota bacterium]